MEENQKIKVHPVNGNGWVVAGLARLEVPEPFTMQVEHSDGIRWWGIILDVGHQFEGRQVKLSKRHRPFMGYVNIAVETHDPSGKVSTGFGILSEFLDMCSPPIRG
jgi:hypothetical protein